MTGRPNPDDFSANESPNKYRVTLSISGSMDYTLEASSKEEAIRKAEEFADKIAEDVMEADLDEIQDVVVDHVRNVPTMYRVTREGQAMQVSRLLAGDMPRDPDARGF